MVKTDLASMAAASWRGRAPVTRPTWGNCLH